MTGDGIDERMERLLKAGWLAIGLSQTDLAEVLDTFQQAQKDGSNEVDSGRLIQVAEALDIPVDSILGRPGRKNKTFRLRLSVPCNLCSHCACCGFSGTDGSADQRGAGSACRKDR